MVMLFLFSGYSCLLVFTLCCIFRYERANWLLDTSLACSHQSFSKNLSIPDVLKKTPVTEIPKKKKTDERQNVLFVVPSFRLLDNRKTGHIT